MAQNCRIFSFWVSSLLLTFGSKFIERKSARELRKSSWDLCILMASSSNEGIDLYSSGSSSSEMVHCESIQPVVSEGLTFQEKSKFIRVKLMQYLPCIILWGFTGSRIWRIPVPNTTLCTLLTLVFFQYFYVYFFFFQNNRSIQYTSCLLQTNLKGKFLKLRNLFLTF